MPRLLWLDVNCSYVHSSLALPYIRAQKRNDDFEWTKLSVTISSNIGDTVAKAIKIDPDIIAATLWLYNHDYNIAVIKRIKTIIPDCTIILGGPEFSGYNKNFLQKKNPEINCVVRGKGEHVFHDWLEVYDKKENWTNISGLCWLDDIYHDNGLSKVSDITSLNPPETSEFFDWNKPFIQLETSRGCFNSCTFCMSGNDNPVRNMPLEKIKRCIKNIHSSGIKEIRLLDRTFNGSPKRAMEILSILEEYPDMRFHLEIHPGMLGIDIREKLIKFPDGILHLEAGVQSLNDKVLNECKRTGHTIKALEGLKFLCSLKNIICHVDLIAGLPFYTLDQLFEDILVLAEYGAKEIQLELLKLLPGTTMRGDAHKWGIKYSPVPPYEVLCTDHISVGELQTARLLSKLIDKYYNAYAWHVFFRNIIINEKTFLQSFLSWMCRGELLDQPLSVEKRGLLLFDFIKGYFVDYTDEFVKTWTNHGLSRRKLNK